MVEFVLFALLGLFYLEFRNSKIKRDDESSELLRRLKRLDAEVRAQDSRWPEIKAHVAALESELAKLKSAPAANEASGQSQPAPERVWSSVVAEPVVPKKVETTPVDAPAEPKSPRVAIEPPRVTIPPAPTVPPLSDYSISRLADTARSGEEQPKTNPQPSGPASLPVQPIADAPANVTNAPPAPRLITPPPSRVPETPKAESAPPHAATQSGGAAHPSYPVAPPRFSVQPPPGPPLADRLKRLLNLEELLGTNYLIKIGVVILVIGIAGFILSNFDKIPTWAQLLAGFAVGLAMVISGARFEEGRYRLLARAGMGGGWALIFLTTWALHHAGKQPLLASEPIDFVLLLIVAVAMVKHSLKYDSQLVTGFAFLLPSLTVTVTLGFASRVTDAVRIPGLVGSAILALGLVAIVVRRRWFEVEVFGIVATYLNHYFWIRPIIENGTAAERSASLMSSAALLVAYWTIFRASYIIRKVDDARQEAISTVAALLNTFLLLGLLKYQAAHPELAFWFLLALGAIELALGQLPSTRLRRTPFVILTTLGATFLTAAIVFKFSGASLPIILLAEAEIFFLVGVFTREIVFRRLGMLAGLIVAFRLDWLAITQLRDAHFSGLAGGEALKTSLVYGVAAAVFYLDAHGVTLRWKDLVTASLEDWSFSAYSYVAGSVAFLGLWIIFPTLWVPVAWSAMALALAFSGVRFKLRQLATQSPIFTVAATVVVFTHNFANTETFHHVSLRLVTVSLVAALFYLTSRWERRAELSGATLVGRAHTWVATSLLGVLVWYECPELWRAVTWSAMALVLALIGRRLKLREFYDQSHFLAGAGFIAGLDFNLLILVPHHYSRLPLETVLLTAALLYACSRQIRLSQFPGEVVLSAAHAWTATALLTVLPWYELRAEYAAPAWMALALALAVAGRVLKLKRYSFQAFALATIAAVGTVMVNLLETSPHTHIVLRLVTVSIVAALLYACSYWAALVEVEGASTLAALHTWMGTGFLAALAWYETPSEYTAPIWCGMALVLVLLGNVLKRWSLAAQGHCLAVAGIASALAVNLYAGAPGHYDGRLLATVGTCAVLLYLCSIWSGNFETAKAWRIPQAYTWAASSLVILLAWYELKPVAVAVAWALFALILLEPGLQRHSLSLRLQSYAALAGSFARIFYVNLDAAGPAGEISPRVWSMVVLAAVYFYAYARLAGNTDSSLETDRNLEASPLFGYFGAITIAALFRAEINPHWVVAAWATMVLVSLALAWKLRHSIFLEQGLILSIAVLYRTALFNLYESERHLPASGHTRLLCVGVTVALLFLAVPLAMRLRSAAAGAPLKGSSRISKLLAVLTRYPDQVVFFIAFGLLTALLYREVTGSATLVWGVEALIIFLFALWAGMRSFRLAAIGLLLICVVRILTVDLWKFEGNSRWLTGIGLGASLIMVGYMSIRYRESIKKYL